MQHVHQAAALGAMFLALAAALVSRTPEPAPVAAGWPAMVEAGTDHITAQELAEHLFADPASVLLVDVRPAGEFESFHLPGAVNLDLVELLGPRGEELLAARAGTLVVLYSNGMTHPAQAWVELARRGQENVRVLEDGLDGFVRDVLTPPSLRGATTPARAARESIGFTAALAEFLGHPARVQEQSTPRSDGPSQDGATVARLASDPPHLVEPTVVSTGWVAARGAALVVLDARDKAEDYAAGHVPGALHVPISRMRAIQDGVADQLLAPDELAPVFGALGIDPETEVVAYGDTRLQDPAHVALALIGLGHQKVAILEGGLTAWKAENRALSREPASPRPRAYTPRPSSELRIASLADVRDASTTADARILDVRPADAYRGDVTTEARAGHIPGSLNRPYTTDVVSTSAGTFWKPVDQLRRDYEAMGLRASDPIIVSCRTGHQAAQAWFTLRYVLGYQDVRWYDGSWTEWAARAELPVETGP